jgi:hypothetical protein
MLIAILGKKKSGKDTVANYLIEKYGFIKYSFADPLKKGLQFFFNLTDEQLYNQDLKEVIDPRWGISPRKLFQVFGTDIFQNSIRDFLPELKINNDPKNHWVNLFKEWYLSELKKNPNIKIVISDARFLHEINMIKELGGIVYKIIRPSLEEKYNDNYYSSHQSEMEIESIPNNMITHLLINDNSLEELYKQIHFLIYMKINFEK